MVGFNSRKNPLNQATSQHVPTCVRCGEPLAVNEEGVAPVYCDRCAGQAVSRARKGMNTGSLRDFPVTTTLIAINLLVFVGMVLTSDSPTQAFIEPSNADLIRWGVNNRFLTLGGDYWRLLTANFLHIGIVHIAFNMWCMWRLGRLSERYFGRWSTAAIYVLTGVGASLLSITYSINHQPGRLSAGASGAIFGIAGALIAGLKFGNLSIAEGERRAVLSSVILFAGFNFLIGFGYLGFGGGIDNMAHLGGFASGLLIGVPLATSLTRSAGVNRVIQVSTLAITTLLFAAAGAELVNSKGHQSRIVRAEWSLEDKDYPAAIRVLEKDTAAVPGDAEALALLGVAYALNNEPAKAIVAYKKALELDPSLTEVQDSLRELQGNAPASQPPSK